MPVVAGEHRDVDAVEAQWLVDGRVAQEVADVEDHDRDHATDDQPRRRSAVSAAALAPGRIDLLVLEV